MTHDLRDFISRLPRLVDKLTELASEARFYLSERRERERTQAEPRALGAEP